ncbi:beta-ketoacyl synthase N-terminal-like domain-containing protein [Streptomyces sp. NBC_01803]|uniref:beta-ketoacyl synthase N-terminal-like domain-containing protein n=1 Tax=Streptomyces sp. NBC_01803 TaxID=2975946 RepID=UPI002DD91ABF|nr:beta-ketoacyl synthase N-terminal-like domain-containing protein [Streptomyces sp. NBC_01803]WSA43161.1 phosphopantetheine-binding protein [Streptomyces sp. NBC_01803]
MSGGTEQEALRALMEDQLRLSRRLRARVRELEDERHAPVAVVGMGLRLPPAISSPEAYWEFLRGDDKALSPIPEDRPGLRAAYDPVPGRAGRSYVDRAGFLSDIAHFDADFFGISQREARLLDPQQRMLLETSWEALERAGIAVRRADRLDVGVYLGMMTSEYSERNEDRSDMSRVDPYYITGGGLSFGAGRVSFLMGFSGPVMGVETACSSSMTALHLAVRGLRDRECRYALAGGANLLLSATLMVSLCQTRALSPDGRSKSFLATADGYGRGEGVGVLALMRLDDAEREGRPVLAVIRGTAVNHDGAASGLTAPNGPAQQEVIRAALADARVAPEDLGFVEAHGTGTALGDPIEIGALDGVVGKAVRRRRTPLAIGSVKSRLGHLEGASGVASVMKTVLMLQHGEIPAAAAPDDGPLNPHIPWDGLGFDVPRRNEPWPRTLPRRVAGINSFGMSGTNVHAVLEAYEPRPADAVGAGPAGGTARSELLTLSAKDPLALAHLVGEVGDRLRRTADSLLPSVCHTLRAGRAPFAHRLAVTGATPAELADALAGALALAEAEGHPVLPAPPRAVTLSITAGADGAAERLAGAVTALAAAFPALADSPGDAPGPGPGDAPGPEERLVALLSRFGLPVRVRNDGGAATGGAGDDALARIEWETAGATHSRPLVGADPNGAPALLSAALGALFAVGADPRLDALRGPGARFVGELPTYPFRRRRYWIDEPVAAADGTDRTDGAGGVPAPPSLDPADVADYLMAQLADVFEAGEIDPELSFLDIGGDSFLSTLFITKVEERFAVGMTADELSLDMPLRELMSKLAESISAANGGAGQERVA